MNRDAWTILYGMALVIWFFGLGVTAKAMWLFFVERPYGPTARWGLSFLFVGAILYGIVEWHR